MVPDRIMPGPIKVVVMFTYSATVMLASPIQRIGDLLCKPFAMEA